MIGLVSERRAHSTKPDFRNAEKTGTGKDFRVTVIYRINRVAFDEGCAVLFGKFNCRLDQLWCDALSAIRLCHKKADNRPGGLVINGLENS